MSSRMGGHENMDLANTSLRKLLDDIRSVSIAVIGDFCLDVYWDIDLTASEASLETGLPTSPVAGQRVSLGGAGNVVNNLRALGVGQVDAYGVVGEDPWGREMLHQLAAVGAGVDGITTESTNWSTLVYVKPHIDGAEMSRLDFGNYNLLPDPTAQRLISQLGANLSQYDAVVVNEQVLQGIHTPALRRELAALITRNPESVFVVDSRHHSDAYPGACLKVNDHEAARLVGLQPEPGTLILRGDAVESAATLFARMGRRPVFVTRGARGCLVYDEEGVHVIPGIQILSRTDSVGAGDSMLAGIAAALAAKRGAAEAATLGNFVAAVTAQKLLITGTATPEEVMAIGQDPNYIYRPELAEDPRNARYIDGTEFEVVTHLRSGMRPRFAIFDHDGTISVLRQGWEGVMEPMMLRAVLGDRFAAANESLYHRVLGRVREFIDKSTGVQTLVQMEWLAGVVAEFGCVPPERILDAPGYKRIFNDALMGTVRERLAKLQRGELSVEDLTLKNAVALLHRLKEAGVGLFLASGTDEADVIDEAGALGYDHLFDGIYGSVGEVAHDAKKVVLERILTDLGEDAIRGLIAFGDGPVEIRETHKRGGFTIGVASDEIRRFGMSTGKRTRLIRAGADLIIPDFSQLGRLLDVLNLG